MPPISRFGWPVAVFLRGDHNVNETKLLGLLRAGQLRPMLPEELAIYFKAPGGFSGAGRPDADSRRESAAELQRTTVSAQQDAAILGGGQPAQDGCGAG